jgi:creatinine amidohydrolase/Fe(II)-dependent formamide hydrolase-like protein
MWTARGDTDDNRWKDNVVRKVRLQDMTSAEVMERFADKPVVLLPFGAQETQGPHVPMGDFVLADRLASEVATRADCVVAPRSRSGIRNSTARFPAASACARRLWSR